MKALYFCAKNKSLNWTLNLKNILYSDSNKIKIFCYEWLDPKENTFKF